MSEGNGLVQSGQARMADTVCNSTSSSIPRLANRRKGLASSAAATGQLRKAVPGRVSGSRTLESVTVAEQRIAAAAESLLPGGDAASAMKLSMPPRRRRARVPQSGGGESDVTHESHNSSCDGGGTSISTSGVCSATSSCGQQVMVTTSVQEAHTAPDIPLASMPQVKVPVLFYATPMAVVCEGQGSNDKGGCGAVGSTGADSTSEIHCLPPPQHQQQVLTIRGCNVRGGHTHAVADLNGVPLILSLAQVSPDTTTSSASSPTNLLMQSQFPVVLPQLASPGVLTLHMQRGTRRSNAIHVLVIDDAAIAAEVVDGDATEEERDVALTASTDALIVDLGRWFAATADRRACAHRNAVGSSSSSGALDGSAASAACGHGNSRHTLASPAGSRIHITVEVVDDEEEVMVCTAIHLLEHAVESGWSALATRMTRDLIDVWNIPYSRIVATATSDGLLLLHRAVRSTSIKMLHTLIRMGEEHGMPWDWACAGPLVLTLPGGMATAGLTPLHLAAVLQGSNFTESLLRAYPAVRKAWMLPQGAGGFVPAALATAAGNMHLNLVASGATECASLSATTSSFNVCSPENSPRSMVYDGPRQHTLVESPRSTAAHACSRSVSAESVPAACENMHASATGVSPQQEKHSSNCMDCCSAAIAGGVNGSTWESIADVFYMADSTAVCNVRVVMLVAGLLLLLMLLPLGAGLMAVAVSGRAVV